MNAQEPVLMDSERIAWGATILKTISHPTRISIAEVLSIHGKLSVGELCRILNTEQSLMSHHLIQMKLHGVLESEREGQHIYYSLKFKDIVKMLDCIRMCEMP